MVWRVNNQFRQAHEQAEASVRAYNDAIARQEDELLVLQSYIEDPRHRTYTYDGNGAAVETVTVSWQGETRTLTEWRAVVYGREAQLQKVKTDRDAVVQNALKGAEYRLWQHRGEVLRDIEASIPEPTGVDPLTIEYQRLNAARDALAALGDYEEARQYNWRLQALLPDLFTLPTDMAEAVDVELKLRHAELVLDDEAASRAGLEPVLADLRTVDTAQELTRRFTMARFHADAMRREIGSLAVQRHLTRAVEYLDQNLRRRDELSALVSAPPLEELLPLAFSQDLYTALAAVRGTTVRTVEGAEAFDRWYAGIV
ncbi:MAG: hypothetical protein HYV03_08745, partial [Deltaproteobacteria bacterium]|nr:hypothetical protein [Deltaproteobacteria bacterium]